MTATNTPVAMTDSTIGANPVTDLIRGSRNIAVRLQSDGQLYAWGFNNNGQMGVGTLTQVTTPTRTPSVGPTVTFGTAALGTVMATSVIVNSATSATVISPPFPTAEVVDIRLTNPDGQSNTDTAADNFTYFAPANITDVSPSNTPSTGGDTIAVNGATFFAEGSYTITVGNATPVTATMTSSTQLTFVAPAMAPGSYDVKVTVAGQDSNVLVGVLTYDPPPTVTGISPRLGPTTGGTSVAITGGNYVDGIKFKKIVAGGFHSCGIAVANDQLYCWGRNQYGTVGSGALGGDYRKPTAVAGGLAGVAVSDVAIGWTASCAIRADNSQLYCWGSNMYGMVATDSIGAIVPAPIAIGGDLSGVAISKVVVGSYTVCAITATTAQLYCWGYNAYGQVGQGNTITRITTPKQPLDPIGTNAVSDVDVMSVHTCAVLRDTQRAYCWGDNTYGKAGTGVEGGSLITTPTAVVNPVGSASIASVATGAHHSCALTTDGTVYCWGANSGAQMGLGYSGGNSLTPASPMAPVGGTVVENLTAGWSHNCVLRSSDKRLYCWGAGTLIGTGSSGSTAPTPTSPANPVGTQAIAQLSVGYYHNFVQVAGSGMWYGFGRNNERQLNVGSSANTVTTPATFLTAPRVMFGTVESPNVTYNSPTSLTAVTPAQATGTVSVRVTNIDAQTSTTTSADSYGYITPANAPTNLSATPGSGEISLSWIAPTDNGGDTITDYVVQYTSDGTNWTTFDDGVSTNTTAAVTNLMPGVSYTFRVAAVNSAGIGVYSATQTSQTLYITVSGAEFVNLSVTPTAAGRTSSTSHTITTSTNSSAGYRLLLSTVSSNRSLVKGLDSIDPLGGNAVSPLTIAANTWGYRVDGLGGFGAGPTSVETDVASSAFTWAGVPGLGSATQIYHQNIPTTTTGQTTRIWYALNSTAAKPSGTYTQTVTYTAISN